MSAGLRWLTPSDAPDAFPPASSALREPNGLLAAGGDLSSARLLAAYPRGIFPWYEDGQPILWWSPDPRAVLWPDKLHVSRSLARTLRRNRFELTVDTAFDDVIAGCATPRRYGGGTWITAEMVAAYRELHRLGWAHSCEAWSGGELAGGIYGIAVGRVFFGESMFSRETDASKAAFVALVEVLRERGFALLDCQVPSSHLVTLGAETLPRAQFLRRLGEYCAPPGEPGPWR